MRISDWSSDVCSSDLVEKYLKADDARWAEAQQTLAKLFEGREQPKYGGELPPTNEIGRAHAELQSLMRISYAVFCLKKKKARTHKSNNITMNTHMQQCMNETIIHR